MAESSLLIADSFRVHSGGRIVAWPLHRARFERGVRIMLDRKPSHFTREIRASLSSFLDRAFDTVRGEPGFPRLELLEGAEGLRLNLTLRPLPTLGSHLSLVSVASSSIAGLRDVTLKGPNLRLHAEAVERVQGEALLTDDDGTVLEGARTALVWWRDQTLVGAERSARVDSVTERVLFDLASRAGVPTAREQVSPSALTGVEVWAVNALHGIRVVTDIDGTPARPPEEERLERWRNWYQGEAV